MISPPEERLITLPPGTPKLTLGWEALAWAAKYLRHPNGIRAGQKWKFTKLQARFVLWFYAVDRHGQWLFAEAHRRLPKGSGKSPFAAALALIEFLAPVRLDRFDSGVLGGCIGKPVTMPWVQIAAVSEKQTENTMRHVRAMTNKKVAVELHRDYQLDVGKTQINLVPEGKLEVITSSATTQEGAEVSFVVGDELEHWTLSNGGVELYDTLMDNLAKSGSRMLGTLNAWKPGIGSVGERVFDTWCKQEKGKTKNESVILMDIIMAPLDTDLSDPESLRTGLEFVYQDCPWANVEFTMARIWSQHAVPDASKRKYLNWPTVSMNAWASPNDIALMARRDIVVEPGEEIVMFFDGSLSRDTTALVGCRISDGHVFLIGCWDPGNSHDKGKNKIDVHAVDERVQHAFNTWDVKAFFADVREFESFTKVTWPKRYRDRLQLWAVTSGKNPEPIAWDMRGKVFEFTRACELTEREIIERAFTHDGSVDLVDHLRNCRKYENRFGIAVRKETPNSAKKIDIAVCVIGARMLRRLYLESSYKQESKHSGRAVFV